MGDLSVQEAGSLLNTKSDEAFKYLTFSLSDEQFAVDILSIREIVEVGAIAEMPLAPDFIRGVVNLRGTVLPVIDLSMRLGRVRSEITKRSCIVVVDMESRPHQTVGLLVDEVREILEITPDILQPIPSFDKGTKPDFLKGMGQLDNRFIVLLDIGFILSEKQNHSLDEIILQHPSGP
jgi:purine-binding chemotaxis protein CheW